MGMFLTVRDLTPFAEIDAAKAEEMIADAEALAVLAAPCLGGDSLTEAQNAAVKAILRGALLRWNEAGSGALAGETVSTGPFSHGQTLDTRTPRKGMFWPSEITSLQSICSNSEKGKAFSVDTVGFGSLHSPICSLMFGTAYCSCGANIAGSPIFEPDQVD
jgi:hypothetical protein